MAYARDNGGMVCGSVAAAVNARWLETGYGIDGFRPGRWLVSLGEPSDSQIDGDCGLAAKSRQLERAARWCWEGCRERE
jgi:hypothetical protein